MGVQGGDAAELVRLIARFNDWEAQGHALVARATALLDAWLGSGAPGATGPPAPPSGDDCEWWEALILRYPETAGPDDPTVPRHRHLAALLYLSRSTLERRRTKHIAAFPDHARIRRTPEEVLRAHGYPV